MTPLLFIPSKNRPQLVAKNLKNWQQATSSVPIIVVVEPQDYQEYKSALPKTVELFKLPKDDKGIAYARKHILKYAARKDIDWIIQSDDDIRFSDDPAVLLRHIEKHGYAGMGAYNSYFQLSLGMHPNTGIHEHYGSMGQMCIGVNVPAYQEVGAYLSGIPSAEDVEALILLVHEGYGPWRIDSDFKINAGKRFEPGGLQAVPQSRQDIELEAYRMLCERFGPEYFSLRNLSKPNSAGLTKKYAIHWKRIYEDAGYDRS